MQLLKLLTKNELKGLGALVPGFQGCDSNRPRPLGCSSDVPKGFLAFITKMRKVDFFLFACGFV